MFAQLNASGYGYNGPFYNAVFEELLSKIILCYNLMIADNVTLSNDENEIRNVLYLNYLNNNTIRKRIDLEDYYFDKETEEDRSKGRTDLRILTTDSFKDTGAYYIIECKRLDSTNPTGHTGLNAKYIEKGIYRFVSKLYSTHYKTNGMIGFLIQPMDIHKNIDAINALLEDPFKQANTMRKISKRNILSSFDFSYYSTHTIEKEEISIYHLMFDCSKNMKPN